MTEEQKTGEETKVAGQNQDTGTGAAGQQQDGGNTGEDQGKKIEVTADVLRAFRDEIKSLKDQNQLYRTQLQMAMQQSTQAFQPQNAPQGTQIPASQNRNTGEISFDIDDDDVVTGADMKKILGGLKKMPAGDPQVNAKIAHLETVIRLNQTEPDWHQTINKYLPDLVQSDPEVWGIIQQSPNPIKAALMFAKTNPKYAAEHARNGGTPSAGDDIASTLEKMIENAGKPAGGKQTGGGGASGVDRFANMTDEEFEAHMHKVISGVS
jgi:TolA-binding protein